MERGRPGRTDTRNRDELAGQNPFTAGSKIATHSTCDVIGKVSEVGILGATAGQMAFATPPKGPLNTRSVKRASRPRYALPPFLRPIQCSAARVTAVHLSRGPVSGRAPAGIGVQSSHGRVILECQRQL
jgi:hypothetical protein